MVFKFCELKLKVFSDLHTLVDVLGLVYIRSNTVNRPYSVSLRIRCCPGTRLHLPSLPVKFFLYGTRNGVNQVHQVRHNWQMTSWNKLITVFEFEQTLLC